jgi:hypothetical protein
VREGSAPALPGTLVHQLPRCSPSSGLRIGHPNSQMATSKRPQLHRPSAPARWHRSRSARAGSRNRAPPADSGSLASRAPPADPDPGALGTRRSSRAQLADSVEHPSRLAEDQQLPTSKRTGCVIGTASPQYLIRTRQTWTDSYISTQTQIELGSPAQALGADVDLRDFWSARHEAFIRKVCAEYDNPRSRSRQSRSRIRQTVRLPTRPRRLLLRHPSAIQAQFHVCTDAASSYAGKRIFERDCKARSISAEAIQNQSLASNAAEYTGLNRHPERGGPFTAKSSD